LVVVPFPTDVLSGELDVALLLLLYAVVAGEVVCPGPVTLNDWLVVVFPVTFAAGG
jgi:hypothetical protein